ncbi:MAG: hypothetical protein KAW51_02005 [Candidatus Lokiarchaeota archaeon]|nr:hypothetical protein [Candidatus Lokiarchaeota archaeon]
MSEKNENSLLYQPKFRVISTWLWFFIGGALAILIISAFYGFNFVVAFNGIQNNRYLYVYIEFFSVGLLPVIYVVVCKDPLSNYGFNMKKRELFLSLLLSVVYIGIMFTIGWIINGKVMNFEIYDFQLDFPLNVFYGIFGIIVWGPLEVFFFIYLVVNMEQIFKQDNWKISKGLIIITILFGLVHLLTTNWWNAIYTGILFFIIGFIYKFSNNIIGPIISWALINGQVWFIAQMLFQ